MASWRQAISGLTVLALCGCAGLQREAPSSAERAPLAVPAGQPPASELRPLDNDGRPMFGGRGVPSETRDPPARYRSDSPDVEIESWHVPEPKVRRKRSPVPYDPALVGPLDPGVTAALVQPADPEIVGSIAPIFDAITFDNDAAASGFFHIPPDSHAAAGPNHVVVVANTSLQIFDKAGVLQGSAVSLSNFFSPVGFPDPPATGTFDPKVVYDALAQRWVLVTLERINSPQQSYIFLAVSESSDPTGNWTRTRITSLETISGTVSWLDYPGLGYDEEAIYLTGNMFSFPGAFQAVRLFVVPKGLGTGGFYDGGAAIANRFNPYAGAGVATTSQPARIIGAPPSAATGTWLTSFSGLSGGGNEFLQIVRVDTPTTTPTFTQAFLNLGNFSNNPANPDAPQSGTATGVLTNDPRALDAVWQGNNLWTTFTTVPNSGTDSGQASARYVRLNTTNVASVTVAEQGNIGGEDIATGAYTFFPAVSVNTRGAAVIGFSASASSIFPGAYAVSRRPTDTLGTVTASQTLRAGTDFYIRTFGGGSNRWGDYSGLATDPVDQCFWIYNQYAQTRGTILGGEDGRWATTVGRACVCEGTESSGDTDLDGICDNADNCVAVPNFGQQNADGDALGDACDPCPGNSSGACTAASADVAISKSNGIVGLTAGSSTTYTITVSNPAASAISGVTVSDSFPAELTGCTWTCSATGNGSCGNAFGAGDINDTSVIAAGGTLTYSATCTVLSTATGSVVNTASVSYGNDPNGANNSATDTDGLGPSADLSISKSDGISSINAGANTTYNIVVSNPSASTVSSVTVADSFPGTLSACSWTCAASSGGVCQSASGSGNIATTSNSIAGNNGTLTFSATCTLSASATGTLVNTATVSYANDPNISNDSATDTDTIVAQADLSISKTDGSATATAGSPVTYTIVATNPATVAVSNVGVADSFPGTLSACSWTCAASSGGSCQSASGSGNIATTTNTIAGNNGTLTFSATCTLSAAATGTLVNTATVSYANDPVAGNNSATDTDTILPPGADLSISKSDGVSSLNAGASTTYSIVVSNPSALTLSDVAVTDNFPASLSNCSWTCAASAGGACQSASGAGNIATTSNSIGASGTLSFSATCTLSASASGSVANTATVSYAGDGNPANDSATDSNTIVPQANLSISKTDGSATATAGSPVTYTIVATNPATVAVSNVGVADSFPGTLSACSWTCAASSGGACQSASGGGNIATTTNTIAGNNGTLTFSATCTLSAAATGTLVNTATVGYANDPVAGNNSATDTDTIVAQADLSISKTDGSATATAGSPVTYTIVATNPATVAVSNVGVADSFPGTLSACSWTCAASSGGSCQSASGSGNITSTSNSIAGNNGTLTFSATCTLSAAATGTLVNTATVSYANDPVAGNNSATDTDTILPPGADLSISKSDGVSSLNAGAITTYSIVVSNPSALTLTDVAVTDNFPASLSSCSWTCAASAGGACQSASGAGNIATSSNSIGASGTLSFSATCTLSAGASGSVANTATVSYAGDGNPANDSATDSNTIIPQANLSISKTDGSATATAGSPLTYTIVATNPATVAVSNVGVADSFPGTLSACSWTCAASSGGSCQSASGSGNIATTTNTIAGNNGTLTFSATCTLSAAATGTLVNTATVSYANDPVAGNNSATDTDTIIPQANLSISKTDGSATATAGSPVTYTIVATNPATVAVSNVGVADSFPGTLSACSWTCAASSGGACQSASGSGNIATTSNSIAGSGGTLSFSATCTLSASATGTLVNTATVSYANDPVAGNNSATDTDTILPPGADLSISKSDGVSSLNAGASTTYSIVVSNPSALTLTDVAVTDSFPASLSSCSWTCAASAGGACQSASGGGNIATSSNSIGASGTLSFSATCTLSAGASGSVANTATVSYAGDGNPANDSATDSNTIIPQADLSISKDDGVTSVVPGSSVSYLIQVNNPATASVSNVSVNDSFPALLSGCSWSCAASAGGACQSVSGSGDIVTTSNSIAAGGTLSFNATCTLSAAASGSLSNTATVGYVNDPSAANDAATDTDTIAGDALFANGFENP